MRWSNWWIFKKVVSFYNIALNSSIIKLSFKPVRSFILYIIYLCPHLILAHALIRPTQAAAKYMSPTSTELYLLYLLRLRRTTSEGSSVSSESSNHWYLRKKIKELPIPSSNTKSPSKLRMLLMSKNNQSVTHCFL